MSYLKLNVNLNKRVRMDGVFLGLTWLLLRKSLRVALPALRNPCSSLLFVLGLTQYVVKQDLI